MKIHLRDRGISRELAILHVHEPHSTKFITEFIEEGTVICDIGANIGYYALLESALTGPKGKVIAIEPISENVELLNANLKLNDIQNVTVVQAAISDTDGKSKLFLSKSSNLPSLFKIHSWKPSLGIREITSYKLDTLLNKMSLPVDFIRMDIEGGEVIALKGMGQVLERYKPRLMIETHTQFVGKQKIVAMLNNLRNYGYDIKSVIDRDRDFPWHKSNHGTRELNIDALVTDKYTVEAERIFTVFLF
jgi:FkbM family methyltransferase